MIDLIALKTPAPREPDLDLLAAVAATGALDRAARSLRLTRSAAERRLVAAERTLGVPLVAGRPGALALTAAGARLLVAGWRLRTATANVARELAGGPAPASAVVDREPGVARLRVAAAGGPWLALAEELAAGDSGVLLDVVATAPGAGSRRVAAGEVDASYDWRPAGLEAPRPGAGGALHHVVDEALWVALPATHPQAHRDRVVLRELEREVWVVRSDPASEALTRRVHARLGIRPAVRSVRSAALGRALIARGWAVGLASPVGRPIAAGANLVLRPTVERPVRRFVLETASTVEPDQVRLLLRGLHRHYAAVAAVRNPRYHRELRPRGRPGPAVAAAAGGFGEPGVLLDDLLLLRAVSFCGSLNRAAPLLLLSQPAASRRIQRLERRLGVPVLARGNHGSRLTPAGASLLQAVDGADADYRAVVAAIRAAGHAAARTATPSR